MSRQASIPKKRSTGVAADPTAWFDRFSPIPGLLTTSGVSLTLLALQLKDFRGSENLLAWIRVNRTLVGIAVQVASHVLGLIYVQVLCAVLKTSFILSVDGASFPIYLAHFIQAASTPRMTWALPWRLSIPLLFIVGASLIPAALWAGALTPLTSEQAITQTIVIPTFEVNTTNISTMFVGDNSTALRGAGSRGQWMTDKGLFAFDPTSIRAQLLQSAAEASALTDNLRKHKKLDRTRYSYVNRSYGTGATAGFTSFSNGTSPNSYTYVEEGLSSAIHCFYNDSVPEVYSFWEIETGTWGGEIVQAIGPNPFGGESSYVTYHVTAMHDVFAWLPGQDRYARKLSVHMISGKDINDPYAFRQLHTIQCDISYKAELFDVNIDSTSQIVWSVPRNMSSQPWPLFADELLYTITGWLYDLTYLDGCYAGCQLGRSLRLNASLLQNATGKNDDMTILRAVEDFLGALTDDIMINLILTRMVSNAPQSTKAVQAVLKLPAVIFGNRIFIIVIVILNTIVATIYIFEVIRTRGWAGLPPFDLGNICDVIISATRGGMLVAGLGKDSSTEGISEDFQASKISPWRYSDTSLLSDTTRIKLKSDGSNHDIPALVPLFKDIDHISELAHMDVEYFREEESHHTVEYSRLQH